MDYGCAQREHTYVSPEAPESSNGGIASLKNPLVIVLFNGRVGLSAYLSTLHKPSPASK